MVATGLWDVTRRRWQVLVVSIEVGVGIALLATTAADSSRPARDILIGLTAGLALGLSLLTPVDHTARHATVGRRRRRRGGRRRAATQARWAQQQTLVVFPATPWPHPDLTEQPEPTFAPPSR